MNNLIPHLGPNIYKLINSFLIIDLLNDDFSINLSKYYIITHFINRGRTDFLDSNIFNELKTVFSWYKWYDRHPELKIDQSYNLERYYILPKRIIKILNNDIELSNLVNNVYNNWPNNKRKAHDALLQIDCIKTIKLKKKYYIQTLPKYKQYFNNWLK